MAQIVGVCTVPYYGYGHPIASQGFSRVRVPALLGWQLAGTHEACRGVHERVGMWACHCMCDINAGRRACVWRAGVQAGVGVHVGVHAHGAGRNSWTKRKLYIGSDCRKIESIGHGLEMPIEGMIEVWDSVVKGNVRITIFSIYFLYFE